MVDDLPAFCWFYSMTPANFRRLTYRDYRAMRAYMQRALDEKV